MPPRDRRHARTFRLLAFALLLGGCQCVPDCPVGQEGCPCLEGACGEGLLCRSSTCTTAEPDSGVPSDAGLDAGAPGPDAGVADAGAPDAGGRDAGPAGCVARHGSCSDGVDDDADGRIDCDDRDCADDDACALPLPPGLYVDTGQGGTPDQLELRSDGGCRAHVATWPSGDRDCRWRVTPSPRELHLDWPDGGAMFSFGLARLGDVLLLSAPSPQWPFELGRLSFAGDAGASSAYFDVGPVEDGVPESYTALSYPTGHSIELLPQDRVVVSNPFGTWIRGPATATGPGPLVSDADAGALAGYPVRFIAPAAGRYTVFSSYGSNDGLTVMRFRADGRPYRYVLGQAFDLAGQRGATSALIADVTRDGRPDVVLAVGCGLRAFAQLPDGGLDRAALDLGAPPACYDEGLDLHAADLDGDGRQDLFLEASGAARSFLALADGGYRVVSGPFAVGIWPRMVPVSPRDGGRPDIAITGSGSVHVFTPDGGGGWLPVRSFSSVASGPQSTLGGDLDGDGRDDVLKITGTTLELFRGAAPPAIEQALPYAGLVPGDFTCRGRLSLLWSGGQIVSFERDGGLTALEPVETYPGFYPKALDVDRDGSLDVVAVGSYGVRVLGRHEGRWAAGEFPSPTSSSYNPRSLAAGDFTGDGCPDVVVGNANVGTSIFIGHCP